MLINYDIFFIQIILNEEQKNEDILRNFRINITPNSMVRSRNAVFRDPFMRIHIIFIEETGDAEGRGGGGVWGSDRDTHSVYPGTYSYSIYEFSISYHFISMEFINFCKYNFNFLSLLNIYLNSILAYSMVYKISSK